jgi:cobalt-zinc-cadmium efflux system membrane fusion protein
VTVVTIRFSWLLPAVLVLAGCGEDKPPAPPPVPQKAAQPAAPRDPLVVELTPEMAQQIQVGAVKPAQVVETMSLPGRIEVDERRLARIGSNVNGRVVEVLANIGDMVAAGKPLARISSPELTQAQRDFLRALSAVKLNEKAVERAKALLAADVIGFAEVQRREAELSVAQAELRAARDQLGILGLSSSGIRQLEDSGTISSIISVTSSINGAVIDRTVVQGQVVQPGEKLFSVADLSTVWVVGGVPEQFAHDVQIGQSAEVEVASLPGEKATGKIVFVSDTVSPETRTVTVRTEVSNPGRKLKPAMLASMRVQLLPHDRLVVPAAAVVRDGDKDFVYVAEGANRYRMTAVELAPDTGGLRPVVKGLDETRQIVVTGAFQVNVERQRAQQTQ